MTDLSDTEAVLVVRLLRAIRPALVRAEQDMVDDITTRLCCDNNDGILVS